MRAEGNFNWRPIGVFIGDQKEVVSRQPGQLKRVLRDDLNGFFIDNLKDAFADDPRKFLKTSRSWSLQTLEGNPYRRLKSCLYRLLEENLYGRPKNRIFTNDLKGVFVNDP